MGGFLCRGFFSFFEPFFYVPHTLLLCGCLGQAWLGGINMFSLDTGFRFADVWLPATAKILAATVVLVTDVADASWTLDLVWRVEATVDAAPFEEDSLPSRRRTRPESVAWRVVEPWVAGGRVTTPDLATLLQPLVQQSGWQSGNAIVLMCSPAPGPLPAWARSVWTFDRNGYTQMPNTQQEFRHFRTHGFAKLTVEYTTDMATLVLERELVHGNDNADSTAADNVNINFGGPDQVVAGFRFPEIRLGWLNNMRQSVLVTSTYVNWMQDGPYTAPLSLEWRVESTVDAAPYNDTSLPAQRPYVPQATVPCNLTEPWSSGVWGRTCDLTVLLHQWMQQPGWAPQAAGAVALAVFPQAGPPQPARRVFGFGRDPRTGSHDFPDVGCIRFQPFLPQPPV